MKFMKLGSKPDAFQSAGADVRSVTLPLSFFSCPPVHIWRCFLPAQTVGGFSLPLRCLVSKSYVSCSHRCFSGSWQSRISSCPSPSPLVL